MARRRALGRVGGLLIVSLAFALSARGAAAASDLPDDYFGVSAPELYSMSLDGRYTLRDAALGQIELAGIESVRTEIGWRDVEPAAPAGSVHAYDWAGVDRHVEALATYRQTLAPMLLAPPSWAQSPGSASSCQRTGGVDRSHVSDYAAFAGAVAARYGRGGDYWKWAATYRPALPQRPIGVYEIWNEPNWAPFWCPGIDPGAYARALEAAADAIHAQDPEAVVSVGGLVLLRSDQTEGSALIGMATRTFLERMVAEVPTLQQKVDAVALHTYAATPDDDLANLAWASAQLDQAGLGDAKLLISELGWHTGSAPGSVSEPQRAAMLGDYIDRLARSDCNLIGVFPHSWITPQLDPANPEDWYGIADPLTGVPLASGAAYARTIAGFAGGSGGPPLGVCSPPPEPTLTDAPPAISSSGSATFTYTAAGAASWECRLDGAPFAICDPNGTRYGGLPDGDHVFEVQAHNSIGWLGPAQVRRWTVDTTPPATAIAGATTWIDQAPRFALTSDEPGVSFSCRSDSGTWSRCGDEVSVTSLADGDHRLEAVAVDAAGNADPTPAVSTYESWTTPATPRLDSAPASGATSGPMPRFGFSLAGGSAECRFDDAPFGPCSGAGSDIPPAPLGSGPHSFDVRARGGAGAVSPSAEARFDVDADGPSVSLRREPQRAPRRVVVAVSAADPAGIGDLEYRVDGPSWRDADRLIAVRGKGAHTLRVRATDELGNVGSAGLRWRARR